MNNIRNKLRYHLLKESNILTEQEIDFLFETETGKIKSFDVNNLDYGDELLEGFELLYELEYKYNKILNSQFSGNEKRRENILNIIASKAEELIEVLGGTLQDVYWEWIEIHDYENPTKTGELRLEPHTPRDNMLETIISTYKRFTDGNYMGGIKYSDLAFIANQINNNPDNFPITTDYLSEDDTQQSQMYDTLHHDGLEEFNEIYDQEFNSEEDAEEFIENYGDELVYDLDILSSLPVDCYYEIYGQIVLPAMLEAHPSLEETIDDNKKILNKLKNIDSLPLSKQFMNINIALNGVHASGSMMEHYENRYAVSEEDLGGLSNRDVSDWDKELKILGFRF